jgi:hypothetical protein
MDGKHKTESDAMVRTIFGMMGKELVLKMLGKDSNQTTFNDLTLEDFRVFKQKFEADEKILPDNEAVELPKEVDGWPINFDNHIAP